MLPSNDNRAAPPWRDLVLLLVILLPWFLLWLDARPLNVPDEGRYPEIARGMLVAGDFITPRNNGAVFLDKPALYYWLQALSFQLFGVSIASVRLMPALFGAAGAVLAFFLGWRLRSRRAAWLSVGILMTSPLWYVASRYANLDIEVAVWISAAIAFFLFARLTSADDHRRTQLFGLAYLAGGLGVLTKGLIGIVLPGLVIFAWMLWQVRWRELPRWRLWLFPMAVLVVCLPWYVAVQRENPTFLHYFFIYQQFHRFTADSGFNNAMPVWFYPAVLALTLLPWSIWLPAAIKRVFMARHDHDGSMALLLVWPLAIVGFFSLPNSKLVGYVLPAAIPLAVMLGLYFDRLLDAARLPRGQSMLSAGVLLALAVGIASQVEKLVARYPEHAHFGGLLYLLVGCYALAAVLCVVGAWRDGRAGLTGLLVAGAALAVLASPIAACMDRDTAKPVADYLKPKLSQDAVVATYRTYYPDLPLYLNRTEKLRVVDDWTDPKIPTVDNWRREFFYALQKDPNAATWLLDDARFKALLAERRPVYLILDTSHAEEAAAKYGMQVLWRSGNKAVLGRAEVAR
jgi:4-amino-4-deoxy-L-arabinose transferase-like glycosyltransferase